VTQCTGPDRSRNSPGPTLIRRARAGNPRDHITLPVSRAGFTVLPRDPAHPRESAAGRIGRRYGLSHGKQRSRSRRVRRRLVADIQLVQHL